MVGQVANMLDKLALDSWTSRQYGWTSCQYGWTSWLLIVGQVAIMVGQVGSGSLDKRLSELSTQLVAFEYSQMLCKSIVRHCIEPTYRHRHRHV
jgi:hypothetical protein